MDIFGENQTRFGKRLGLKKGTILRLEGHREGQRPKSKHLSLLRLLRAPNDKAELLEALLKQMEEAIEEERRAEEALQREGLGSLSGPLESQNGEESPLPLAERLEQVAQRAEGAFQHAEQARLAEEAWRAQEARRQEEATQRAEEEAHGAEARRLAEAALRTQEVQLLEEVAQRTEQAAQRVERLRLEQEARCQEEARARDDAARQAALTAQHAEQLWREVEAGRAADAGAREEAARWVEQAAQRIEQRCREVEAGRAEDAREREEVARRAERAALRAEQLLREAEARRAEEARKKQEASLHAQKTDLAQRRQLRRLVFAALAASAVLGALGGGAVLMFNRAVPRAGLGDVAQVGKQNSGEHETAPADRDLVAEDSPESGEVLSSGLDGGMELPKLVTQVLPFPKGALREQLAAPCPASVEEINGLCWVKLQLSAAQVRDGVCESLRGFYEPSDGWCRTHNAAYRPFYAPRRRNNAAEP